MSALASLRICANPRHRAVQHSRGLQTQRGRRALPIPQHRRGSTSELDYQFLLSLGFRWFWPRGCSTTGGACGSYPSAPAPSAPFRRVTAERRATRGYEQSGDARILPGYPRAGEAVAKAELGRASCDSKYVLGESECILTFVDASPVKRRSERKGVLGVPLTALCSWSISAAWMALVTCGACGNHEEIALTRGNGHEQEAPGAREAGARPVAAARGIDASTRKASAGTATAPDGGRRGTPDSDRGTSVMRDSDGGSRRGMPDAGSPREPDEVPASTQEAFYFLSSPAKPDGPRFARTADALSAYVPGGEPMSLLGGMSDTIVYLVDPPNERGSNFLLGLDIWSEGGNQYVFSYDPLATSTMNHGRWGGSPWGTLVSNVDAAVKLDGERLAILVWDALQEVSRLWLLDATVAYDKGELVYESPGIRLAYHGVDAAFRAVLSDGHSLLFLDERGEVNVVASPDDEFHQVKISPFASGLLTVGQSDGATTMRVYDDSWLQANVSDGFEKESVAWLSANSLVFGVGEEVVVWNPYDGSEPDIVPNTWEGRRPSGVSVPFRSGAALSAVLDGESSIVFSNGESTSFCGPSTAKIRTLQPWVREDIAGVLFDEVDPNDDTQFGELYFCAPNEAPVPLLAEHSLVGKLLAP